eukprot:3463479-Karenia_brevis.AAC.1
MAGPLWFSCSSVPASQTSILLNGYPDSSSLGDQNGGTLLVLCWANSARGMPGVLCGPCQPERRPILPLPGQDEKPHPHGFCHSNLP